ncbi:sigma factor-like helix-turn-helix DNA-binding protein [Actinoplanes sp. NPDC048796]|uniref:sigma factor-like helix-turn-helix DNA-binding protein n=1 Tax=unclassified Actinoplanes TaxID=2626549 RepID=UPI0033D5BEBE
MRGTMTIDDGLHEFLGVRDRLLRIARGIAGPDAEDVVQDAWLRWNGTDRTVVRDAPAFLSRTTTRLSLTRTTTAYARHQSPVGLWPAERAHTGDDPAALVVEADQLRGALALLLSRLGPRERVAYLLREAFALPYRQIAGLLGVTEAHARQLIRRARTRLETSGDSRVSPVDHHDLLAAFREVARTGDPAPLVSHSMRTAPS